MVVTSSLTHHVTRKERVEISHISLLYRLAAAGGATGSTEETMLLQPEMFALRDDETKCTSTRRGQHVRVNKHKSM